MDGMESPPPGETSGIPEGLAELAALRLDEDWASLPHSLLGDVFRRLLEQLVTVEEIVKGWQTLALVCKSWQAALQQSTPLCLELTKPGHLSPAARRWLSRVPMEVVVLARTMSPPVGADCQLLAAEGFQRHSASVLRSLVHVGPDAAPLLHNFSKLKQVAIYCSNPSDRARRIDAAVFHQLPKLNCLTIAGYWGVLDTEQLPGRLKHLALSNYNEQFSLEPKLPPSLKQLELLSLRADGVVLDWLDACARCQEVHVAAEALVLGVGARSMPALAREVGLTNLQQHMYKTVGAAMTDGEHFQEATLAFFNLMLFSGPLDRGVMPIDADEFLQTLRDDLLPIGIDVNPALEVHAEFVRDVPSQEACFVLELVKQEAGKPKSLHFATPVTDSEVRLLTTQPVWRISWCEDPRAPQILSDPAFIAQSKGTLTDLLSIALVPELDLRPFGKLLSVLGMLRCDDAALATVLRRMPRSLESFCITAEGSQGPRDFNSELVRHLRHLREVSLYGHRRHNLSRLRRGVTMIRILNPIVEGGEAYVDAEHGGHSHKHGGGIDDERHSKQSCQDPFCPLHSGKTFLQISLTDERQQSAVDFSALLAAGFQMLTITLSAEHPQARCTLVHEGSWKTLLAALEASSIEVLELNCQAASMAFRSSSLLHRLTEVPVESAMRYVAEHFSDTWQVKSWNGNTAADGVLEGSRGYALMRRSVVDAHQQAQLQPAA
ncbi:hypothetical protein ABPG75_006581 [Micractinium tetrahymenae]